jgi:serine/threonine protein kinase
MLTFDPE